MKTLSLFAAILFLCCSSATSASEPARDKVIAEVQRLGGAVEFDETKKDRPIVKVDLHGTKVTMSTSLS